MSSKPVVHPASKESLEFPWGSIKWLINGETNTEIEQTFGLVFINPGQNNPKHYHPNCEEILYVLSGTCEHTFGDNSYQMGPGDTIRIPKGIIHHAINTGWEPLRSIISFSSGDRQTVFLNQE